MILLERQNQKVVNLVDLSPPESPSLVSELDVMQDQEPKPKPKPIAYILTWHTVVGNTPLKNIAQQVYIWLSVLPINLLN